MGFYRDTKSNRVSPAAQPRPHRLSHKNVNHILVKSDLKQRRCLQQLGGKAATTENTNRGSSSLLPNIHDMSTGAAMMSAKHKSIQNKHLGAKDVVSSFARNVSVDHPRAGLTNLAHSRNLTGLVSSMEVSAEKISRTPYKNFHHSINDNNQTSSAECLPNYKYQHKQDPQTQINISITNHNSQEFLIGLDGFAGSPVNVGAGSIEEDDNFVVTEKQRRGKSRLNDLVRSRDDVRRSGEVQQVNNATYITEKSEEIGVQEIDSVMQIDEAGYQETQQDDMLDEDYLQREIDEEIKDDDIKFKNVNLMPKQLLLRNDRSQNLDDQIKSATILLLHSQTQSPTGVRTDPSTARLLRDQSQSMLSMLQKKKNLMNQSQFGQKSKSLSRAPSQGVSSVVANQLRKIKEIEQGTKGNPFFDHTMADVVRAMNYVLEKKSAQVSKEELQKYKDILATHQGMTGDFHGDNHSKSTSRVGFQQHSNAFSYLAKLHQDNPGVDFDADLFKLAAAAQQKQTEKEGLTAKRIFFSDKSRSLGNPHMNSVGAKSSKGNAEVLEESILYQYSYLDQLIRDAQDEEKKNKTSKTLLKQTDIDEHAQSKQLELIKLHADYADDEFGEENIRFQESFYGKDSIHEFKQDHNEESKRIMMAIGGTFRGVNKNDIWKSKAKVYSKEFLKQHPEFQGH